MIGISPRKGTWRWNVRVLFEIRPPRMMVSPSAALTVAWAVIVSTRGERMTVPF